MLPTSPTVICCVTLVLIQSRKSTPKPSSANTVTWGEKSRGTVPTLPAAGNTLSQPTKKTRQSRRRTEAKSKTQPGPQRGFTTQRPKPYMRSKPTTQEPSTDVTSDEDHLFNSDPTFFNALDIAAESAERRERRREEVLKAFQGNSTGRFKSWPFPFTESTYVHEFNTLNMKMSVYWKNATRDFTELRREYVPESRSLHVAEMFTAYRRRGTHFFTVLGIEGWDGNIFEYPEIPYKYKDNPGSKFSAPTEEVLTRDPRVERFTNAGDSLIAFNPRYNLGRQGEWIIEARTNESRSPEMAWPYKFNENDPDSQTIMLRDLPTFAPRRRRRGLRAIKFRRGKPR